MKIIKLILLLLFAVCIEAKEVGKLTFFMQQTTDYASTTQYGNNSAVGSYAKADDAKIYYEVYGKGEPLVVLHGGGVGSMYEMGQFIDNLSKNYQVIAISTRGHGKSEIGSKPITLEQRANDAYSVIKSVTSKPVVVLGFSDGAYTGYKLASLYPKSVKKLIAIGAGENLIETRKFVPMKVEDIAKLDPVFMKNQMLLMPEPDRLQQYWVDFLDMFNNTKVSKELLGSIKCPVLLISGEKDANAPLLTVISAYKMIPDANLAIIQDAPHQVFITNFQAVWANIVPFLEK